MSPPLDVLFVTFSDPGARTAASAAAFNVGLALDQRLKFPAAKAYTSLSGTFLPELRAHKLWCEGSGRSWAIQPSLDQSVGTLSLGRLSLKKWQGRQIGWFESSLRILSDGPTLPAIRSLRQLQSELQPRLMVFLGLGAGTCAEHQGGDVIVTTRAGLHLEGDLETCLRNGSLTGSPWSLPDFGAWDFPSLQEPPLLAPSPCYQPDSVQLLPHQPQLRISPLPVLTRPQTRQPFPEAPSPREGDKSFWGDRACALDLNAGALVDVTECPLVFVVGLASPAVIPPAGDAEKILRNAWLETYWSVFADDAARNVALVAERFLQHVAL